MGVLNLMPWAGPTMRAATVLGIEAGSLWSTIIPIQIFGIVLALAHSVLTGFQEKKRGAGLPEGATLDLAESKSTEEQELARPKLFWFNLLLTIAVIALLIWDELDVYKRQRPRSSSASTAWTPPTGRRTSGCAWPAVPTASGLPSAKAPRMYTP